MPRAPQGLHGVHVWLLHQRTEEVLSGALGGPWRGGATGRRPLLSGALALRNALPKWHACALAPVHPVPSADARQLHDGNSQRHVHRVVSGLRAVHPRALAGQSRAAPRPPACHNLGHQPATTVLCAATLATSSPPLRPACRAGTAARPAPRPPPAPSGASPAGGAWLHQATNKSPPGSASSAGCLQGRAGPSRSTTPLVS